MAWSEEEKTAWLEGEHTKNLLGMLNGTRKCGGSWSPFDNQSVWFTATDIKKVLATREHIPNKKEAKELRRSAAKKGR